MFEQQPVPERRGHLRPVKPPKAVWVDLGAVYPLGHRPRVFVKDGLDLQTTVPGELRMWDRTTTGHWVGWVTFPIRSSTGTAQQGQWVFSDALTPRVDARGRSQPDP